jgi:hypothetical protein
LLATLVSFSDKNFSSTVLVSQSVCLRDQLLRVPILRRYMLLHNEIISIHKENELMDIRIPEQEADVVVAEVKRELRGLFVKSDALVKRLGNALKKIVKKERDICEEIKITLKEEIAEGIISTRTIELQCPPEWKRKTKPTRENEKISFSKLEDKPRHKVAAMQGGQSITETEKEDGNGLDTSSPARGAETDINSDTHAPKSDSATITLLQEETAGPPHAIDIKKIYSEIPSVDIGTIFHLISQAVLLYPMLYPI